jgi:hypothetical protein
VQAGKTRRSHEPAGPESNELKKLAQKKWDSGQHLPPGVLNCPFVQVAKVGLEPTQVSPLDFESSASAIPPLGLSCQDR